MTDEPEPLHALLARLKELILRVPPEDQMRLLYAIHLITGTHRAMAQVYEVMRGETRAAAQHDQVEALRQQMEAAAQTGRMQIITDRAPK